MKISLTKKLIIVSAICLFVLPIVSKAYTLLEPLPGGPERTGVIEEIVSDGTMGPLNVNQERFSGYMKWFFGFALAFTAFLAVVYIVVGGIWMMTAGANEVNYSKGQSMVQNAIWGLVLAVSSFLILNTINPNFVSFSFDIEDVVFLSGCARFQANGQEVCDRQSFCKWNTTDDTCVENSNPCNSDYPRFEDCVTDGLSRWGCKWIDNQCTLPLSRNCPSITSQVTCRTTDGCYNYRSVRSGGIGQGQISCVSGSPIVCEEFEKDTCESNLVYCTPRFVDEEFDSCSTRNNLLSPEYDWISQGDLCEDLPIPPEQLGAYTSWKSAVLGACVDRGSGVRPNDPKCCVLY